MRLIELSKRSTEWSVIFLILSSDMSIDALQLEYTGRVFAAAKASKRSTALASSSQLRQILPGSVSSYHEALDTLDEQLVRVDF